MMPFTEDDVFMNSSTNTVVDMARTYGSLKFRDYSVKALAEVITRVATELNEKTINLDQFFLTHRDDGVASVEYQILDFNEYLAMARLVRTTTYITISEGDTINQIKVTGPLIKKDQIDHWQRMCDALSWWRYEDKSTLYRGRNV